MEARADGLTRLCLYLLFINVVAHAKITIQDVPHGILTNRIPVRTSIAMYHLVIVFGAPETSSDVAITKGIQNIQDMVAAEKDLVGQELILSRLSIITEQYKSITSRRKKGLIDFVGDMVKSLFGFGTDKDVQELKGIVSQNRNSLKTIVHNTKHLLSVVNVTRYEMIENRKAINQLIDATKLLKEWVENTKFRVDRSF